MSVQIKRAQRGVTLLEVMLVLAIASLMIVTGLRMYQSFQNDTYASQLRANVDSLFQGLSNYYWANCIQYKSDSTTVSKPGTLDPAAGPSSPFAVTLTSLNTAGYLPRWPLPPNPLINTAATDNSSGYVLQFNLRSLDRKICMAGETSPNCTKIMGTIYMWRAQVAVHMKNASLYRNILAADCASTYSNNTVAPCVSSTSTGEYLVWERLASFASPETMTTSWPSMPLLQQFNEMYTTYPINKIINQNPDFPLQQFLCNG